MRTNYPTREIGREVDYEGMKRRAFIDQGIVVAKLDDPRLDSFERQFLQNIGRKLSATRASFKSETL
jgi:hypothetical protein